MIIASLFSAVAMCYGIYLSFVKEIYVLLPLIILLLALCVYSLKMFLT